MKCNSCNQSWNISDLNDRVVRYCPFCGNEIKEDEKSIDSISDCLRYIISEFGEKIHHMIQWKKLKQFKILLKKI